MASPHAVSSVLVLLLVLSVFVVVPFVQTPFPSTPIAELMSSFAFPDDLDNDDARVYHFTKAEEDLEESSRVTTTFQVHPLLDLDEYQAFLANPNSTASKSFEAAPRTFLGEYNQLEPNTTKYFVYSPSGGMGNQLYELILGCLMARRMNRTLVVPMLGSHSSMWYGYEHLPTSGLYPMDRILDFPHMQQYCQVVPLNISVVKFTSRFAPAKDMFTTYHRERLRWRLDMLLNLVQPHRGKTLVYFHGVGMYSHGWITPRLFGEVMQFVRFSPYLRLRAMEIVRQTFGSAGGFNAVHIRLGDYSRRWPADTGAKGRYIAAHVGGFKLRNTKLPLYLATDEPDNPSFGLLRSKYKVTNVYQLPRRLLNDYGKMFPKEFRLDMEGVLDQLVCSQAQEFVPTTWSTFSESITKIRKHKRNLFPELDL
ncbi:hypothetical protein BASA81_007889 [Batrachochytrium salamandrivorans]|nr:hypothetical protein BASA81_007889 [Batrachochytrium salamandrivorans]